MKFLLFALLILLLTACGSSGENITPPTVMQMPTLPPSHTPPPVAVSVTPLPTQAPTITLAPSATATAAQIVPTQLSPTL
ncbi:MAG: hypothetical protein JXA10_13005, partial [Anaerolineae bacterium]|nr:hypothetical protein [Anaerolineae bacterium]